MPLLVKSGFLTLRFPLTKRHVPCMSGASVSLACSSALGAFSADRRVGFYFVFGHFCRVSFAASTASAAAAASFFFYLFVLCRSAAKALCVHNDWGFCLCSYFCICI
jgi:hypothetical protein